MSRTLKLERPLAVFDIESTGVVPQRDRIVELAVIRIDPDGSIRKTVRRLNPQIPIPAGATAVHGISDADVAECPSFADIAEKLYAFLDSSDFYSTPVKKEDRSLMNVVFRTPNADLDAKFVADAIPCGLTELKGHRLVGGCRASIYNAMPMEGIDALIAYMKKFEMENR